MVGNEFKYEFSNQDIAASAEKKNQSPSQRRRNYERQMCYNLKTSINDKNAENHVKKKYAMKDSEVQTDKETKVELKDSESQTEDDETKDNNDDEKLSEVPYDFTEVDANPCESCLKMFDFHQQISDKMCDKCKLAIAERERIEMARKYRCDVCNKTFKTKTCFMQHKQCNFEEDYMTFICEVCNKLWVEEEDLEHHMNQNHEIHVCVRCNATLEGKSKLDEHFKTKHRAF